MFKTGAGSVIVNHFDIDGTLTFPGSDFWFAVCREVIPNHFENEVLALLNDPGYDAASAAMQSACRVISAQDLWINIERAALKVAHLAVLDGVFRAKGLATVNECLRAGQIVSFQTANFHRAALVIIKAILQAGMIKQPQPGQMFICGSTCNYVDGGELFCNFGPGKLKSAAALEQSVLGAVLKPAGGAVNSTFYFDDPFGNDADLMNAVSKGYMVVNEKNRQAVLPTHVSTVFWD